MPAKKATTDENEILESDDQGLSKSLAENQLYDFISNQPVKDRPIERVLQTIARAMVDDFDHTQLQRDQSVSYEVIDEQGRSHWVRRKVDVAIFIPGALRDDQTKIIRVCIVQVPGTKANDPRKGIYFLEEVLGGLPDCDYGLWTNGTDLVFKQKLSGDLRLEPEYEDLYDLPGNAETAVDLDDPDRQVGHIATGENLQCAFARVHDYIY